jgi:hypothetical protein
MHKDSIINQSSHVILDDYRGSDAGYDSWLVMTAVTLLLIAVVVFCILLTDLTTLPFPPYIDWSNFCLDPSHFFCRMILAGLSSIFGFFCHGGDFILPRQKSSNHYIFHSLFWIYAYYVTQRKKE